MTWVLGRNLPSAVIAKYFPQANNHNPKTPTNASPHSNLSPFTHQPSASEHSEPPSRTPTLISILTNQTHFDKKEILQKMKTAGFSRKQTTDAANYLFKKLLEINRIQAVSRNQQPGSNHQHPVASSLPNLEEAIDINHFLALGQHETAWYLAEEAKNKAWNHADYPAVLHFLEVQIQIAERAYSFNTDFQETTTLFAQKRQVLALLDQINQHREAYHQARQIAHSNLSKPQEQRVRSAQKIQDLLTPLQKSIPVTSNQSESNHSRLSAFTFQPSAASEASPPNLSASLSLYQYKIQYFLHLLLEEQDQLIKISQNSLNCFQQTPNLIQTYPESYVRTLAVLLNHAIDRKNLDEAIQYKTELNRCSTDPRFPFSLIKFHSYLPFWVYFDQVNLLKELKDDLFAFYKDDEWISQLTHGQKLISLAQSVFFSLLIGENEKAKKYIKIWESESSKNDPIFLDLHFRILKSILYLIEDKRDLLEFWMETSRKKFARYKSDFPALRNVFLTVKKASLQVGPINIPNIKGLPMDFYSASQKIRMEVLFNYPKLLETLRIKH